MKSKFETRNPKQIQMINRKLSGIGSRVWSLTILVIAHLSVISCLEIRIYPPLVSGHPQIPIEVSVLDGFADMLRPEPPGPHDTA